MIAAALLVLGMALAGDPPPVLPSALAVAIKNYDRAQWSGDRALLDRSLADDYILINSAGGMETKSMFVGELTDPAFKLSPFTVIHPVERLWRNGAVTGGLTLLQGADHGTQFSACLRFSDVWARRDGSWKVIYTHASRAKPDDCK